MRWLRPTAALFPTAFCIAAVLVGLLQCDISSILFDAHFMGDP
jgi:hypothetical protein